MLSLIYKINHFFVCFVVYEFHRWKFHIISLKCHDTRYFISMNTNKQPEHSKQGISFVASKRLNIKQLIYKHFGEPVPFTAYTPGLNVIFVLLDEHSFRIFQTTWSEDSAIPQTWQQGQKVWREWLRQQFCPLFPLHFYSRQWLHLIGTRGPRLSVSNISNSTKQPTDQTYNCTETGQWMLFISHWTNVLCERNSGYKSLFNHLTVWDRIFKPVKKLFQDSS